MTVELSETLQQELDQLAGERGLSTDQLAHYAIKAFVLQQRDLDAAIRRGDDDIASRRLLEHDEVVARIDRLLTAQ